MTRTELEALLQQNFPNAWYISSTPLSDPRTPDWAGRIGSKAVERFQVGVFDTGSDGTFKEQYYIALHHGDVAEDGWSINIHPDDNAALRAELEAWLLDYASRPWSQLVKVDFNPKLKIASIAAINNAGNAVINGLVYITGDKGSRSVSLLSTTDFFQL